MACVVVMVVARDSVERSRGSTTTTMMTMMMMYPSCAWSLGWLSWWIARQHLVGRSSRFLVVLIVVVLLLVVLIVVVFPLVLVPQVDATRFD